MTSVLMIVGATLIVSMVVLCLPPVVRALSRLSEPPLHFRHPLTIAEWRMESGVNAPVTGRQATGRHVRLVAVSDKECHFGFKHEWIAADLRWPLGVPVAGLVRLKGDGVLQVLAQTSLVGYTLWFAGLLLPMLVIAVLVSPNPVAGAVMPVAASVMCAVYLRRAPGKWIGAPRVLADEAVAHLGQLAQLAAEQRDAADERRL